MSLVTDSLAHSSSSDDFAAFLDGELDGNSSNLSSEQEGKDELKPETERMKRRKIEEPCDLHVEASIKTDVCACGHVGSFGGLCCNCWQSVEEKSGVTFAYIHKELTIGHEEIARLRNRDMKNLLHDKKLYLILDLDHKLLNSSKLKDLTLEEEYLKTSDSLQGSLFVLELHVYIYTMGDHHYVVEMAKLLDPNRQYFSFKVISRDDSTKSYQQALDQVPAKESAIVILDDTERAWPNTRDNLIVMERYHYFASSCRHFGFSSKSLSHMRSDENELDAVLAGVLKVLKQIYNTLFDELGDDIAGRDVRQIVNTIRNDILNGCKIVFSHVFPMVYQSKNHELWKMAKLVRSHLLNQT